MSLVVYNTITRKKEEFKSIHEGLVGMYVGLLYMVIHI